MKKMNEEKERRKKGGGEGRGGGGGGGGGAPLMVKPLTLRWVGGIWHKFLASTRSQCMDDQ